MNDSSDAPRGHREEATPFEPTSVARNVELKDHEYPSRRVGEPQISTLLLLPANATPADSQPETIDEKSTNCTLQQKLELAIRQSVAVAAKCHSSSSQDAAKKLDASINAEMAVFSSSGRRGRCPEQAYQYLLSIPPTSVEAERALLAAAGVLCTKLQSRLDNRSLDTFCFLRSYYKRE